MPKKNKIKEILTPEEYERFKEGSIPLKRWDKIMEPLIEEVRESERITAKDLNVTINY